MYVHKSKWRLACVSPGTPTPVVTSNAIVALAEAAALPLQLPFEKNRIVTVAVGVSPFTLANTTFTWTVSFFWTLVTAIYLSPWTVVPIVGVSLAMR